MKQERKVIIDVDGTKFSNRNKALNFFLEAMMGTDGSEQSRMTFAYLALREGATRINTYKEIAL